MPSASQNAQISAILGRRARATTRTSLPAKIVGNIDVPSTGNHTDSRALDRSSAATSSGRGLMFADLPVRLTVNDPGLAAEIRELFGPMAEHPGPYEAEIVVDGDAPARPEREPDESYEVISLWRDGDELLVDSGGDLRAHATATRAVVGGATGGGPAGAVMLRRIAHHVIAHLLSLNGRLVAHGAAVGRDGKAVLLLGGSGAGKSTSAYLASLAGWSLLSDDLVVVRRDDQSVEAVGIHRALAVPPDVAEADAAGIEFDFRGRRRPNVTLDARPFQIAAVAIVAHGVGQGRLDVVTGVDIARVFLASAPAAGNTDVAAEVLRSAGVLATLPCFQLFLPDTAEGRLARVAGLFDEIARRAGIAN